MTYSKLNFMTTQEIFVEAFENGINIGDSYRILSYQEWCEYVGNEDKPNFHQDYYKSSLSGENIIDSRELERALNENLIQCDENNEMLFMPDKGYQSYPSDFWDNVNFDGEEYTVSEGFFFEPNFSW